MVAETSLSTHGVPENDAPKGVPAFLVLLYRTVDDESTDHMIRWSTNGDSFFIRQPDRLIKEVFGHQSKHFDYLSFASLLKAYHFRRITHRQQGTLCCDHIHGYHHYIHTFFRRNQQKLLDNINREDLLVSIQASGICGQSKSGLTPRTFVKQKRLQKVQEANRRLNERLDQSTEQLDQSNEQLDQLTEQLDQLTERQDQMIEQLNQLLGIPLTEPNPLLDIQLTELNRLRDISLTELNPLRDINLTQLNELQDIRGKLSDLSLQRVGLD